MYSWQVQIMNTKTVVVVFSMNIPVGSLSDKILNSFRAHENWQLRRENYSVFCQTSHISRIDQHYRCLVVVIWTYKCISNSDVCYLEWIVLNSWCSSSHSMCYPPSKFPNLPTLPTSPYFTPDQTLPTPAILPSFLPEKFSKGNPGLLEQKKMSRF